MVLLSFWSGFMYESWDGKTFPQPLPTYTTRIFYLHFGCLSQVVYPNCPDFLNYLYYLKLFNKFCKKKKSWLKKKKTNYRYFTGILKTFCLWSMIVITLVWVLWTNMIFIFWCLTVWHKFYLLIKNLSYAQKQFKPSILFKFFPSALLLVGTCT